MKCRARSKYYAGISEVLDRHDSVVVVEDDVVVSPFFLRFMNEALSYYGTNRALQHFRLLLSAISPSARNVLHPWCRLLGWATWRDRWKYF